jgi:hypothetical protein
MMRFYRLLRPRLLLRVLFLMRFIIFRPFHLSTGTRNIVGMDSHHEDISLLLTEDQKLDLRLRMLEIELQFQQRRCEAYQRLLEQQSRSSVDRIVKR